MHSYDQHIDKVIFVDDYTMGMWWWFDNNDNYMKRGLPIAKQGDVILGRVNNKYFPAGRFNEHRFMMMMITPFHFSPF